VEAWRAVLIDATVMATIRPASSRSGEARCGSTGPRSSSNSSQNC